MIRFDVNEVGLQQGAAGEKRIIKKRLSCSCPSNAHFPRRMIAKITFFYMQISASVDTVVINVLINNFRPAQIHQVCY